MQAQFYLNALVATIFNQTITQNNGQGAGENPIDRMTTSSKIENKTKQQKKIINIILLHGQKDDKL